KALSGAGYYTIEMIHDAGHDTEEQQHKAGESQYADHQHHELAAAKPADTDTGGKYYCPMHCEGEKLYDKPGNCPVCGMNLEKVPGLNLTPSKYTCPMHPEIIQDGPGSCPICGMDLV